MANENKKNIKKNLSRSVVALAGIAVASTQLAPAASAASIVTKADGTEVFAGVKKASGNVVLPLPSKSYSLTSAAGGRCMPVYAGSTVHYGQDFGAPGGTPILSIADGVVTMVRNGTDSQAGVVVIKHNIDGDTYYSMYAHMWNATKFVQKGQTVKAGQKISEVGTSGASTGNHLHFEMWGEQGYRVGKPIEPIGLLTALGAPSASANATYDLTGRAQSSTCTYYTVGSTAMKTQNNGGGTTIVNIPAGSMVQSKPGDATESISGYIRVQYGKTIGWIPQLSVSPKQQGTIPGYVGGANYSNLSGLPWGPVPNIVLPVEGVTKVERQSQTIPSPAPVKSTPKKTTTYTAPKSTSTAPKSTSSSSVKTDSVKTTNYTVKKGDTLYKISKNFDSTVAQIKSLNGLSGNTIYQDQKLKVPAKAESKVVAPKAKSTTVAKQTKDDANQKVVKYTVKKGDNLYRIAINHKTTVSAIKNVNKLKSNTIYVGDVLEIPVNAQTEKIHTVQKGDNLYRISKKYDTSVAKLMKDNNLSSIIIYVGDKIVLK